jgi:threonine aldolase
MRVIDLRSDTVTLPTDEMRQAMSKAELGDDVFGEDPTVNRLEEMAANLMGKEAALFTPSGTMSNLIAVLTHARPGNEILLGSESHMFWYEVGGASTLGNVVMRTIPNDRDGRISPDVVTEAIRLENIHNPPTTLLCLENTHNRCSGAVLTDDYTSAVTELAHRKRLKVHLDGARIFNASVALKISARKLAKPADSVSFCLSKGLSAPVGSLLCGSWEFVEKARKWRKMLGGGMRQAGAIAAAGIIALEKMVDRLADDHATAKRLALGLASIPTITVNPERVQTNIVVFKLPANIPSAEFFPQAKIRGVKLLDRSKQEVRAVTHRQINAIDIDEVLNHIEFLIKELS